MYRFFLFFIFFYFFRRTSGRFSWIWTELVLEGGRKTFWADASQLLLPGRGVTFLARHGVPWCRALRTRQFFSYTHTNKILDCCVEFPDCQTSTAAVCGYRLLWWIRTRWPGENKQVLSIQNKTRHFLIYYRLRFFCMFFFPPVLHQQLLEIFSFTSTK